MRVRQSHVVSQFRRVRSIRTVGQRAMELLEPQFRFWGQISQSLSTLCPQNGTAVLKGLIATWYNTTLPVCLQ